MEKIDNKLKTQTSENSENIASFKPSGIKELGKILFFISLSSLILSLAFNNAFFGSISFIALLISISMWSGKKNYETHSKNSFNDPLNPTNPTGYNMRHTRSNNYRY